jgi:hypothetical protein
LAQDIQRVKVPIYNRDTRVTATLAFDDTPGGADTTSSHRASNSAMIRIYKDRYFPDTEERHHTYPNIILLVASWKSITTDAHNPPADFTSALGKSMYNLSSSGLVDHARTNVVVVVTKSLSSSDEFDDYESIEEKNVQWMIEAARRRGIVADLQRKVFPRLAPWNTIFVENGGGTNVHAKYPKLPNGELSHQNLFDAIQGVFEAPGPHGSPDLTGMHALDVFTGDPPLSPGFLPETKILVNFSEAAATVGRALFPGPVLCKC